MEIDAQIKKLCDQIVQGFNPDKVILFGSYANGKPDADSDVDIMVIMPFQGRSVDQAIEIRKNVSVNIALDLMVRSPAQIEERLDSNDFFIKEIIDEGKVLYESKD